MAVSRRVVQPEWLDTLPATDPAAVRSRADLRRVNGWMGAAGMMARLLRQYGATPPRLVLELGAGDGTFMLKVARRMAAAWPGVQLRLIDRQALVSEATVAGYARLGWRAEPVTADVFDALEGARADLVCANLFLHHFEEAALRRLIGRMQATAPFVAVLEPARSRRALAGTALLGLIGCNRVTRHDARVSVRAGFAGTELSALFAPGWMLHEAPRGMFSHALHGARPA